MHMINKPHIWYAIDIPGTPFPREIHLADGTHLRFVPDPRTKDRALYITEDGRINGEPAGYVMCNGELAHKRASTTNTANSQGYDGRRKQRYYRMFDVFGRHQGIQVHTAVLLAWSGPQNVDEHGEPFECHHLNGITSDNHVSNLIWLSHEDHLRFDKALKQGHIYRRDNLSFDSRMDRDMSHHQEH